MPAATPEEALLGAPVSSSGNEFPNAGPEKLVDGLVNVDLASWAAQGTPNWVEVDLGGPLPIDRLKVMPFAGEVR